MSEAAAAAAEFMPALVARVRRSLGDEEPPGSPVSAPTEQDVGSDSAELESGLRSALASHRLRAVQASAADGEAAHGRGAGGGCAGAGGGAGGAAAAADGGKHRGGARTGTLASKAPRRGRLASGAAAAAAAAAMVENHSPLLLRACEAAGAIVGAEGREASERARAARASLLATCGVGVAGRR